MAPKGQNRHAMAIGNKKGAVRIFKKTADFSFAFLLMGNYGKDYDPRE